MKCVDLYSYLEAVDINLQGSTTAGQFNDADTLADAILAFLIELKTFFNTNLINQPSGTKTISLTIPGQSWGTYYEILAKNAVAAGAVDYINILEYDITLATGVLYADQIIADLQTYTGAIGTSPGPNNQAGWGIPASMIQVGLMPQYDGSVNTLTVGDALKVTQTAITPGAFTAGQAFRGILTWNLDRDSQLGNSISNPCTNPPNPPYIFTDTIRGAPSLTQGAQGRRNQNARQGTPSVLIEQ